MISIEKRNAIISDQLQHEIFSVNYHQAIYAKELMSCIMFEFIELMGFVKFFLFYDLRVTFVVLLLADSLPVKCSNMNS